MENNNNLLDQYRQEAEKLYPDPPKRDFLADRNLIYHLREAHIRARMRSKEDMGKLWDDGYLRGYYEAQVKMGLFKDCEVSNKTECLSTHNPPLLDIEKLVSEAIQFVEEWLDLDESDKWQYDNKKNEYIKSIIGSL